MSYSTHGILDIATVQNVLGILQISFSMSSQRFSSSYTSAMTLMPYDHTIMRQVPFIISSFIAYIHGCKISGPLFLCCVVNVHGARGPLLALARTFHCNCYTLLCTSCFGCDQVLHT
ncbi:maf1 protein [Moniliophthora roreri]|nr:maf1 protein [Moniliophthora roreri]